MRDALPRETDTRDPTLGDRVDRLCSSGRSGETVELLAVVPEESGEFRDCVTDTGGEVLSDSGYDTFRVRVDETAVSDLVDCDGIRSLEAADGESVSALSEGN